METNNLTDVGAASAAGAATASPVTTLLSNDDCIQSQHVNRNVHIKTNIINEKHAHHIAELRQLLHEEVLYIEYKSWCCDEQLHRFLIARNFKVHDSFELLMSALKWRTTRIPSKGILGLSGDADWEHKMSHEGKTGKIFVADSFDKWGRPVLVMDSSVQNTSNIDDQQTFLAWNLDLACSLMNSNVDKYVIWINLDTFSIFNSPSMSNSTETLYALTKAYPERLGHLIVYKPTMFLYTVFSAVKYLLDAKTLSKILFISGDVSKDSENDKLLSEVIGSNWKEIIRMEYPSVSACARGYDHSVYWPNNLNRIDMLKNHV